MSLTNALVNKLIASRHARRLLKSLTITNMQIAVMVRYHFTQANRAIIKKTDNTNIGKSSEKPGHKEIREGMLTSALL